MEALGQDEGVGSHWFQDLCSRLGRLATFGRTGRKRESLTQGELLALADKARNMSDLLPLRLAALRIDEAELARQNPQLLRDMQSACHLCDTKSHCTWDFVVDASNPRWEEYCPNARALRAVEAMQATEDKSG
jgi:hypothetical protein